MNNCDAIMLITITANLSVIRADITTTTDLLVIRADITMIDFQALKCHMRELIKFDSECNMYTE